jgi:hypothetical protein
MTAVGSVAPAAPSTASTGPAVVRAPEAVLAVVTAPRHVPPASTAAGGLRSHPVADVAPIVAPGLATAPRSGAPTAKGSDAPAAPAGSAELRLAARRLLSTCVEIIGGFRPIAQLRPYCAPEHFDAIVNRLLRPVGTGRGLGATRGSVIGAVAAPMQGRLARTAPEDRVAVRRVQICTVMDGVAELAVVLSRRSKTWAMALRMERTRTGWKCMHLEVL